MSWLQGLSWALIGTRDLDRAEPLFHEYRQLRPAASNTFSGLATIAYLRGDLPQADAITREAIEQGTPTALAFRTRSYMLAELERWEEAETAARRALAMDGLKPSRTQLAWVLIASGRNVSEGAKLAEEATQDVREDKDTYTFPFVPTPEHCLGLAAIRQGHVRQGIAILEEAAEARPDRTRIREDLEAAKRLL